MNKNFKIDWRAVGQRLRVTRIALDITEQQAAAGFGVGVPIYRRYEAGRSAGDRIIDFATRYDVSLDWLICGEPTTIGRHLAEKAFGKVAILPCTSPWYRLEPRIGVPGRPWTQGRG